MPTSKRLFEGDPRTVPGNVHNGSGPEGPGFTSPTIRPSTDDAIVADADIETRVRATGAGSTVPMAGTEDIRDGTPRYPLGATNLAVITGITTDTTGPAAGGIDVNYTIGSYTGVECVITASNDPHNVLYQGSEASSTPLRVEVANFADGVGPGTGVAVDVYARGYKTVTGTSGRTSSQLGPWAARVEGTTA
jgi:hypothetical protein